MADTNNLIKVEIEYDTEKNSYEVGYMENMTYQVLKDGEFFLFSNDENFEKPYKINSSKVRIIREV